MTSEPSTQKRMIQYDAWGTYEMSDKEVHATLAGGSDVALKVVSVNGTNAGCLVVHGAPIAFSINVVCIDDPVNAVCI